MYPRRGQIGADGNLYITYGNAPGPYGVTSGQVWKYALATGTWTNITPLAPTSSDAFGYDGVALDPEKPGTLVVTTVDRHGAGDTMFRSTSAGGAGSWVDLKAKATFSRTQSSWAAWGHRNRFGNRMSVVIDPFNSNNAFYGTDGGIFGTTNLTNADKGLATAWSVAARGVEETVPQVMGAPSAGPHLLAVMADVCGFVFNALTTPPDAMISTQSGTGAAAACTFGSSIDWAKVNPSTMVLVGTDPYAGMVPVGVISTNGGASWTAFPSLPAGMKKGQGSVAISGDGAAIVWSPDTSDNLAPLYTTDGGSTWTKIAVGKRATLPVGAKMLSDGATNGFYAWVSGSTVFYVGSSASSWTRAAHLPATPNQVTAVPGIAGDLWIASNDGLYHSTSSGTSWSAARTVTVAAGTLTPTAIGFGKAAAGARYPAIYVGGKFPNGTTGLVRSVDGGVGWVQINDGNHQWGGIDQVVGDMQTFGAVYVNAVGGMGSGIVYGTSAG
jgi:hypothetical protein